MAVESLGRCWRCPGRFSSNQVGGDAMKYVGLLLVGLSLIVGAAAAQADHFTPQFYGDHGPCSATFISNPTNDGIGEDTQNHADLAVSAYWPCYEVPVGHDFQVTVNVYTTDPTIDELRIDIENRAGDCTTSPGTFTQPTSVAEFYILEKTFTMGEEPCSFRLAGYARDNTVNLWGHQAMGSVVPYTMQDAGKDPARGFEASTGFIGSEAAVISVLTATASLLMVWAAQVTHRAAGGLLNVVLAVFVLTQTTSFLFMVLWVVFGALGAVQLARETMQARVRPKPGAQPFFR